MKNSELNITLEKLRATQTQLIQSEKMASLGELTAGIAHEIQNPLNFVNNFSEVSAEMIDEVFEELGKKDFEEAQDILNDLKSNLDKISHHGNRASTIVNGMLEHSKETSGEKVETNINALCDEYLKLSYHGLRAKDNNFSALLEKHLDENLTKVKVIAPDIGRVLLNIFNNAFYAVHKKKQGLNTRGYEPRVELNTVLADVEKEVRITITDNGIGMNKETLEKVFQPFFTTKPTGQGTGLGMSISYDIVTKGHGGEIKIESEEGKGSTFMVILPL